MQGVPRPYLVAGVAATALMIIVNTVDGLTRPGYSLTRHWVSHLSLGDRGWLGVANLVVCGLLIAVFGTGLRRISRWGGGLIVLAGVALIVAGVFRIDPGLDYPPGTVASHTTTGSVHDAAAGVLFASLIAGSVVLGRATRSTGMGLAIAVAVVITFAACSVLAALDYAGTWPSAPSGLLEKVALFIALIWLVITGARSRRLSG